MKRTLQNGFTLIELVVVIVILGILAAVAIPQFTDLSTAAKTAVGNATCGALQSSAVMLFASTTTSSTFTAVKNATTTSGVTIAGDCTAPTATPTGGTAVACTAIASNFCSG